MRKISIFLLLSLTVCFLRSEAYAINDVSSVLGRSVRLDALCADFENEGWLDDYNRGDDYWHDPRNDDKRGPESLKRVTTPAIGSGALQITRLNDPKQQEMLSPAFSMKLGRTIKRSDQPVFLVRIWLPPFEQWGEAYHFGFRQQVHSSNVSDDHSTSIWLKKDQSRVNFFFRAANGQKGDIQGGPKVEPGWWTLAIAFDGDGVGHYYVSQGADIPTEEDKVFDTTRFPAPNNPLMSDVIYSYFAISAGAKASPPFVIDGYEVWAAKR